ncbi:MAG TPA: hypothetical protein VHN74_11755 [Candidatus Angelobacter sp.]|jgi:hypothetical protein|nr:hypothetical protein [Candidatus Angelobacter sp.]
MAERKENLNRTEEQPQAPGQGGRMTEASPNPHNEAVPDNSPVEANHSQRTGDANVAQTTSTPEGNLVPSVGEAVAGAQADTDSMFNNADPQTEDVRRSEKETHDAHPRSPDRKTA